MIDLCERCHEPLGDEEARECGLCIDCTNAEPAEPDEGDWVTEDHIVFREFGGKGVIKIPLGGPWQPAVRDRMEREEFWPNVWLLSDHGNYHLLDVNEEE